MDKKKVLFICIHNSARSQMAEAYLNKFGADNFEAESAGLEPGELNPVVVEAMKEDGIDISNNKTQSVFDLFDQKKEYDYVIAVCSKEAEERCPIFPGRGKRLHWPFEDPSSIKGDPADKLAMTREIRNKIRTKIEDFVKEK